MVAPVKKEAQKAPAPATAPKAKKATNTIEYLEKLQKMVDTGKQLIGEKVTIKKGPDASKKGTIKNLYVDGKNLKFSVLIDGRSPDDVFGFNHARIQNFVIENPEKAKLFKGGSGVKSEVKNARKVIQAASASIRKSIREKAVITPEQVRAVVASVEVYNRVMASK